MNSNLDFVIYLLFQLNISRVGFYLLKESLSPYVRVNAKVIFKWLNLHFSINLSFYETIWLQVGYMYQFRLLLQLINVHFLWTDIALKILKIDSNIATADTACGYWRALEVLARKPFAIYCPSRLSLQQSRLYSCLFTSNPNFFNLPTSS